MSFDVTLSLGIGFMSRPSAGSPVIQPKHRENYVANRLDKLLRIEKITKIEAAKYQLRTACRLFFETTDSVSVHTLAWAVHEILERYPKSAGSLLLDIANQSPETRKAHAELTEARDFFKHYHKKPLKTIHLIENLNEWLLIDCGQMYRSVTGKFLKEVCAVNAWVSVRRKLPIFENDAVIEYFSKLNLSKTEFLPAFFSVAQFGHGFE
jgi:hypothetical protein